MERLILKSSRHKLHWLARGAFVFSFILLALMLDSCHFVRTRFVHGAVYFGGGWEQFEPSSLETLRIRYVKGGISMHQDVPLYTDKVIVDSLGNGLYRFAANRHWKKNVPIYPLLKFDEDLLLWGDTFLNEYESFLSAHPHFLTTTQIIAIKKYIERNPDQYGCIWMFD